MAYLAEDQELGIRRMRESEEDYGLLVKWLSDPEVAEYYEGRTKLYDREMVLDKFGPYARGEEPVCPCIIEFEGAPIGYIQFYESTPQELEAFRTPELLDMSRYDVVCGFDVFLGETAFWNRGIGTRAVRLMAEYLFALKKAKLLVIDPQTWNKRAIRCYEKCGFRPLTVIERAELHDDELVDCLVMYCEKPKNG